MILEINCYIFRPTFTFTNKNFSLSAGPSDRIKEVLIKKNKNEINDGEVKTYIPSILVATQIQAIGAKGGAHIGAFAGAAVGSAVSGFRYVSSFFSDVV